MKTLRLSAVLISIFAFNFFAKAQTKDVECGNLCVTIPQSWSSSVEDLGTTLGLKLLLVLDEEQNHVYFIMQYSMNATPEYILEYGVINNATLKADAEFGTPEKVKYQSFDACSIRFNKVLMGNKKVGKAIAFCEQPRSYVIVAMANPGESFDDDVILKTFRLTGKDVSTENSKSSREQLKELINTFKGHFGAEVGEGVTFDNMELAPDKDVLTLTYGLVNVSKADIDAGTKEQIYDSMRGLLMAGLDDMAKSFKVFQQCKDENYTFVIKLVDMNKSDLFSYTITPDDYKK